ncbi:hypothetical protein OAU26_05310 [Mariniblastus sp.]|nr:hypothetical protein [Mariniblastus sp.]
MIAERETSCGDRNNGESVEQKFVGGRHMAINNKGNDFMAI